MASYKHIACFVVTSTLNSSYMFCFFQVDRPGLSDLRSDILEAHSSITSRITLDKLLPGTEYNITLLATYPRYKNYRVTPGVVVHTNDTYPAPVYIESAECYDKR